MKGKADVKMKFYLWLSKKKIQSGDSVKTRNKDRERGGHQSLQDANEPRVLLYCICLNRKDTRMLVKRYLMNNCIALMVCNRYSGKM